MKHLIAVAILAVLLFFAVKSVNATMYDQINYQRKLNHLPALKIDKQLEKNATKRACEIKKWSHDGAWDYFVNNDYQYWGGNLSRDFNTNQAMKAFMRSPTHRENILDKGFVAVGVGYCGRYIVQHFGGY